MGNINKHTVTQTHFIQNGQKRRKKENREQEKIQIQIYQKSYQEEGGSQEEKGQESQENPQGWQEMASLEGYPRKNRWWPQKERPQKEQVRQDRLQTSIWNRILSTSPASLACAT